MTRAIAMNSRFRCITCAAIYEEPQGLCLSCGHLGGILPVYRRPAEDLWKGEVILPASEVIKEVRLKNLSPYPIPVAPRFVGVLYGPQWAGKSTMMLRIGDKAEGNVLYIPIEEGLSDAVRDRLRRFEIVREGFLVAILREVDTIDKAITDHEIRTVLLDSLTASTLNIRDLVALARDRNASVIVTAEVNKDNEVAGERAILHSADLVVRVEDRRWTVEKSRFGGVNSGEVL